MPRSARKAARSRKLRRDIQYKRNKENEQKKEAKFQAGSAQVKAGDCVAPSKTPKSRRHWSHSAFAAAGCCLSLSKKSLHCDPERRGYPSGTKSKIHFSYCCYLQVPVGAGLATRCKCQSINAAAIACKDCSCRLTSGIRQRISLLFLPFPFRPVRACRSQDPEI